MSLVASHRECPICYEPIQQHNMIYFHKANLGKLSTRVQEVAHFFHQDCVSKSRATGYTSCALCKRPNPEWTYELADYFFNDQDLSAAFAERKFEAAAELVRHKEFPENRLINYLEAALEESDEEAVHVLLKNGKFSENILADLVTANMRRHDHDKVFSIVKYAKMTPELQQLCLEYAKANHLQELEDMLQHGSFRTHDAQNTSRAHMRSMALKVACVGLGALFGALALGGSLWWFFGLKKVGVALLSASPALALGSVILAKKSLQKNHQVQAQ